MIGKIISAVFDFIVSVSALADGAYAKAPQYLDKETAFVHAFAAKLAEDSKVPAELLLSMAYVESRYNPYTVSRVRDGVRRTGVPPWTSPPKNVTGPYFCGITQAQARYSWKRCLELRDISEAYRTTVKELNEWLRYCKNDMTCALAGYGGGFPMIRAGTSTYPSRVLSRARAIRKAASS